MGCPAEQKEIFPGALSKTHSAAVTKVRSDHSAASNSFTNDMISAAVRFTWAATRKYPSTRDMYNAAGTPLPQTSPNTTQQRLSGIRIASKKSPPTACAGTFLAANSQCSFVGSSFGRMLSWISRATRSSASYRSCSASRSRI